MSKVLKPHLATDADESKLVFPLGVQNKLDGCRCINFDGKATGRSLKPHKNKHVTATLSKPEFSWLDGEICVGEWNSQSLCRDTTSAINRIEGQPEFVWWCFDYIPPELRDAPYSERYKALVQKVEGLSVPFVKVVPLHVVNSLEELRAFEDGALAENFEGIIIRSLNGRHKSGRCTVKEAAYLRIKRFTDAEARVKRVVEAMHNANEAKVNELGLTERSTHQANMVEKGMVGSLICECLETGMEITVGPGAMDHNERKYYWENQHELVGNIIKYKSFKRV
jgi:DNA ligase-1